MKTRTVLAIALAVSWATASARDYMGMEPIIVDAKEIEGVTSESGETIKILLRAEDTAGQYTTNPSSPTGLPTRLRSGCTSMIGTTKPST